MYALANNHAHRWRYKIKTKQTMLLIRYFRDPTINHLYLPGCLLAYCAFEKSKRLDADQNTFEKTLMKADAKVVEAYR